MTSLEFILTHCPLPFAAQALPAFFFFFFFFGCCFGFLFVCLFVCLFVFSRFFVFVFLGGGGGSASPCKEVSKP